MKESNTNTTKPDRLFAPYLAYSGEGMEVMMF